MTILPPTIILDVYVDINLNIKMHDDLPLSTTHEVRDRCLCLHLHRAARAMARRFDEVLRPLGLTHGQYSLMMALNRPDAPRLGDLAPFLAMDRTTLTANLKPLERRGWIQSRAGDKDRRSRRLTLTDAGREVLVRAVPLWRAAHDAVDDMLAAGPVDGQVDIRPGLLMLSGVDRISAGKPTEKLG